MANELDFQWPLGQAINENEQEDVREVALDSGSNFWYEPAVAKAFMKTRSLLGILCVSLATLSGQGGIVYLGGPSFPAGNLRDWSTADLDMNHDGAVEFSFWSSGMICTMDIPTSSCGWPFYVRTGLANEVLMKGNDVSPQLLGEQILSEPATNAIWNIPGGFYGAGVSHWWYNLRGRDVGGHLVHTGWSGGVGEVGIGYLGVRFHAADGLHYGWIRVRLPRGGLLVQPLTENSSPVPVSDQPVPVSLELMPVVVDWAYESRTNTPIRAGDIGSDGDSVQFRVEFFGTESRHGDSLRDAGKGSAILTGSRLRCELGLNGKYASVELCGPSNPRSQSRALWSLGNPLVSSASRTAFFGDTELSHTQLIHLARGMLYVRVDDGELVGRILPREDDKERKQ
jgi:hypothetical protein